MISSVGKEVGTSEPSYTGAYIGTTILESWLYPLILVGFPGGSGGKNLPAMQEPQETQIQSLGWEDPLEEGMATHSSILAWRISWTEEPSGLQSIGSQRVGYDSTHVHTQEICEAS